MSGNLDEFQIGDFTYRAYNMSARVQFHVARRIGPLLVQLLPVAPQLTAPTPIGADGKPATNDKLLFVATLIEPLSEALAKLSDADCDYVLDECLSVVQRRQEQGNWVNVWNRSAKASQFADIDLSTMLQIVVKVLASQLTPFTLSNNQSTPAPDLPGSRPPLN